jgi:uncharacterized membrane protein YgdD (TMEM256/DUF423 family)
MVVDIGADAVLLRAEWINNVLIAGVLLSGAVCCLKYSKKTSYEALGAKLPLATFPIACIAYSIAHAYCTWLFVGSCARSGKNSATWEALTQTGPLIFAGMRYRQAQSHACLLGWSVPVDRIEFGDPTLWLFYAFCGALFCGCMCASTPRIKSRPLRVLTAVLFVLVNWIIGSVWSHHASRLLG